MYFSKQDMGPTVGIVQSVQSCSVPYILAHAVNIFEQTAPNLRRLSALFLGNIGLILDQSV